MRGRTSSSTRARQGRKKIVNSPEKDTLDSSSVSFYQDDSFDDTFLLALDQLKLLGYEEYIKRNDSTFIPIRDVLSKFYSMKFYPGILEDSIHLLKRCLSSPQYCSLSMDFHPIHSMIQFVETSEFFIGSVAPLSPDLKLAREIVVFIIRGLNSDWEFIAGYVLVCNEDDSWAICHTLFKMIEFLLGSKIYVVNVSLSKDFEFEILEKNSHLDLQDGAFIKHPFKGLDLLCFTRNIFELLRDLSTCMVQYSSVSLTSQIVEKYNLIHKVIKHRNLRLFLGDSELSADSIFIWFSSWKTTFENDWDFSRIGFNPEPFFMHMIGKWFGIMRFLFEPKNASSNSIGFATGAHVLFLKEVVWIVKSLEEVEVVPDLCKVWGNIRKTTTSVLALHEKYFCNGCLTLVKPGLLKSLTLHKLWTTVTPFDKMENTPLLFFKFLQHVNAALLLTMNTAKTDFEDGHFLQQFSKHCFNYVSEDDSLVPDVQELGLYVLSSHIVTILVKRNTCEKCRASLVAKSISKDLPPQWVEAIETRKLFHPSVTVYDTLQWAESHLINTEKDIFKLPKAKSQFAFRVLGEMAFSIRNRFPSCHDSLRNMLNFFVGVRLQMMAEDITKVLL